MSNSFFLFVGLILIHLQRYEVFPLFLLHQCCFSAALVLRWCCCFSWRDWRWRRGFPLFISLEWDFGLQYSHSNERFLFFLILSRPRNRGCWISESSWRSRIRRARCPPRWRSSGSLHVHLARFGRCFTFFFDPCSPRPNPLCLLQDELNQFPQAIRDKVPKDAILTIGTESQKSNIGGICKSFSADAFEDALKDQEEDDAQV